LVSPERARVGAAATLLAPAVPLIFQGEEWAASTPFPYFTDHRDSELAEAVRKGRRAEFAAFGWDPEEIPDPQSKATFGSAVLEWEEVDQGPHAEMLEWYRNLLARRRALVPGAGTAAVDEPTQRLSLRRPGLELEIQFGDSPGVRIGPA